MLTSCARCEITPLDFQHPKRRTEIADIKERPHATDKETNRPEKPPPKERYSVTLSKRSEGLLDELKEFTDAETITEVFRDSLRLSYLIMAAQKKGLRVELRDPADPLGRPALIGVGSTIPG